MKIEVFDDWYSVGHLFLGGIAIITPLAFTIYILYQFVEFCIKNPKREEKVENFLGDIAEFLLGLAFTYLAIRTIL